ncbi:MAG: PAS domain S-box protein [Bacteroidetes bacterium]|nr:PAS domain S-box protein [Bacteroidota bacterium]
MTDSNGAPFQAPGSLPADILFLAINQNSDAILITDYDGKILFVNHGFEVQTGYTRDEVIGKTPGFLNAGIYDEDFYKNLWKTLRAGKVFTGIEVNKRKNGSLFFVEHSITPLTDTEGSITHFIGTWKESSKKKQDNETLDLAFKQSELIQKKMEGILEHANDAIISISENETIEVFNKGAELLFGYTAPEVIGLPITLLIPERFAGHHSKNITRFKTEPGLNSGKLKRGPLPCRKKDGTEFSGEFSLSQVKHGQSLTFTAIIRDVSERTGLINKLQENEEKYRTLSENARDIIVGHDFNGKVTYINREGFSFFGLSGEKPVNRNILDYVEPKYRSELKRRLTGKPDTLDFHQIFEIELIDSKGTSIPFEINTSPIIISGKPESLISVCRNITDRKLAEQALAHREKLSNALLDLTRKFEQATTLDAILSEASLVVKALVGYQSLWIYHFSADLSFCKAMGYSGIHPEIMLSEMPVAGDRMLREIATARSPVLVENAETDERTNKEIVRQLGNKTILNIPVFLFDGTLISVGTGTFGKEEIKVPNPQEMEFLTLLASHIGVTYGRIESTKERKKALEALTAREKRFRALLENSAEGILLFSPDGVSGGAITYVSPSIHKILGYFPDELLGKNPAPYIHPEDLPDLLEKLIELLQVPDEVFTLQYRVLHKSKVWRWVESTISNLIDDDNIKALIFNFRDITERKKDTLNLQRQLIFTHALNSITSVIASGRGNQKQILDKMAEITGETLGIDRCLIFKIESVSGLATSISKWIRKGFHDVLPENESYPISAFQESTDAMGTLKVNYIESHENDVNPLFIRDGAESFLHGKLKVKSLLWYPFDIVEDSFYMLVFNQMNCIRKWESDEFDYISTLASEVTIAIKNIQLNQKLVRTVHEMETMVEGIPDSIFFKDGAGRWLITNASAQKLFRIENIDWYGKTDEELGILIPETAEAHLACIDLDNKAWVKGSRIDEIEILKFTDAPEIILEVTKIPIFEDHKPIGLVIVAKDVTFELKARETITEQAMLLDNATDSIIVTDLSRNVLYWNHSAELLYGRETGEMVGREFCEKVSQHPEAELLSYRQVIEKGEHSGEFIHCNTERTELNVEIRKSLIRHSDGSPRSILHIITDVTEKRKAEQQFLRAQRMESIGRMAGGIAHDLNNILSPILIAVQTFNEKLKDEHSQHMIGLLETNVDRAADLMKRLLMFTKGTESRKEPIKTTALIQEIEKILRSTFPKNINVTCVLPADLHDLTGDSTQLHQVLLNLCVNARDAMPMGGELIISGENIVFHEDYIFSYQEAKAGNYVLIKVTDTGTGIPKEIQDKIFDPFFTTKDLDKGTGLGLSTVSAILKSHGGFINVHSEQGHGSQFRIYLPAGKVSFQMPEKPVNLATRKGNQETILIVDDEDTISSILGKTLEAHHYQVLTANNGLNAVALFAKNKDIKVVITDLSMPVMDGKTLIRTLQAIRPSIKIIAMSGLTDSENQFQKEGLKVDGFLPKPFRAEKVLDLLSDLLASKSL